MEQVLLSTLLLLLTIFTFGQITDQKQITLQNYYYSALSSLIEFGY